MQIIGTSSINIYGRESSVPEHGKSSFRKLSVCPERVDEYTSQTPGFSDFQLSVKALEPSQIAPLAQSSFSKQGEPIAKSPPTQDKVLQNMTSIISDSGTDMQDSQTQPTITRKISIGTKDSVKSRSLSKEKKKNKSTVQELDDEQSHSMSMNHKKLGYESQIQMEQDSQFDFYTPDSMMGYQNSPDSKSRSGSKSRTGSKSRSLKKGSGRLTLESQTGPKQNIGLVRLGPAQTSLGFKVRNALQPLIIASNIKKRVKFPNRLCNKPIKIYNPEDKSLVSPGRKIKTPIVPEIEQAMARCIQKHSNTDGRSMAVQGRSPKSLHELKDSPTSSPQKKPNKANAKPSQQVSDKKVKKKKFGFRTLKNLDTQPSTLIPGKHF